MIILIVLYFSLVFLTIGYFLGKNISKKAVYLPQSPTVSQKQPSAIHKAGVLDYPTQEDIDYVESGEAQVDAERERVFREQFKL